MIKNILNISYIRLIETRVVFECSEEPYDRWFGTGLIETRVVFEFCPGNCGYSVKP